jgi:2-hydroxychromene-2-carboxylate isomerase
MKYAISDLADTQLATLARRTGAAVAYQPLLLGAVLKETGNASPKSSRKRLAHQGCLPE